MDRPCARWANKSGVLAGKDASRKPRPATNARSSHCKMPGPESIRGARRMAGGAGASAVIADTGMEVGSCAVTAAWAGVSGKAEDWFLSNGVMESCQGRVKLE